MCEELSDRVKSSQVKSAPTPAVEPNVRAEAEKRKIYTTKNDESCTTYKHLSQNVEEITTWSRNPGNTATESPIGPHFSQQFPNCPKPCTRKTFLISCPKFVAGVHAEDMLDVVSMQVSSSPSVRQVNLQCKKRNSSIESCISLTRKKFCWHGTSDPRAYSTHAKYHAIVLTNLCPVEAPQCNEQVFETERHTSSNVFCIMVGALQRSKLLKKQLLRNNAVDV